MMGKITILILCLMVALTSQASATLADEPPAQIEPLATLSQVESIQQSMESRLASLETSNATTPYMISQLASIQEAHASRLAAQDETQAQVVLQLFALLEQNEITTAIQNAVLENALIYSNYVLEGNTAAQLQLAWIIGIGAFQVALMVVLIFAITWKKH